jgi:hypothetical protein
LYRDDEERGVEDVDDDDVVDDDVKAELKLARHWSLCGVLADCCCCAHIQYAYHTYP